MSVLNRLVSSLGRRDEVPNQELAQDLAARKDKAGIREIAENLGNKDKNIQADCIKVLYEVGYIEPGLIAEYTGDFSRLLRSKNNQLVWGGMTAYAEKTLPAVNSSNKVDFIKVLEKRLEDLSGSGLARVKKVIKQANKN